MLNKLLAMFKTPSADVLAQVELDEARRDLLAAETGLDYARSMVDYNRQRIARLQARTGGYRAGTAVPSPLRPDALGRADIAEISARGSPGHQTNDGMIGRPFKPHNLERTS